MFFVFEVVGDWIQWKVGNDRKLQIGTWTLGWVVARVTQIPDPYCWKLTGSRHYIPSSDCRSASFYSISIGMENNK